MQRRATGLFDAIFRPEDPCIVVSQDWAASETALHLSTLSDFAARQDIGLQQPDGCSIANTDHARSPALSGRVYFLNPSTNVIMHMYDDRGVDITAKEKSTLHQVYVDFNHWVPDYDRARVDAMFGDSSIAEQ